MLFWLLGVFGLTYRGFVKSAIFVVYCYVCIALLGMSVVLFGCGGFLPMVCDWFVGRCHVFTLLFPLQELLLSGLFDAVGSLDLFSL